MRKTDFISFISIDDKGLPAATPEVVHERNVANYDILQDNRFGLENNKNKKHKKWKYDKFMQGRSGTNADLRGFPTFL